MSYTPDNQLLEPSLDKIIGGTEEFLAAAKARIADSRSWQDSHIDELQALVNELTNLQLRLMRLKQEVR